MTGDLTDHDLVLRFESLGDNCELGLVQRRLGAEPLGLLRFAGAPLEHLLPALRARFDGIGEAAQVRVLPENGEYMIKLAKYDFIYHADVKVGQADPDRLREQHARTVGFLAAKLIADLESPGKIMVFRQNEPLAANDLVDLRAALATYGPAVLLWVQPARPGHPPGTVDVADEKLMIGYVTRLAPREDVPALDLPSWLSVLRRASAQCPEPGAGRPPSARPNGSPAPRVDLVFGKAGNAATRLGHGWSTPEIGFTWAIEDRSLLTLDKPGPAADYWLEMEVVPYLAPPSLPSQSLRISVNGTSVHTYDALPRGRVGCIVPGHLLRDAAAAEIVMEHPDAASPRRVAGENDDRRLAIAFRSLSLVCT